MLVCHDSIDFLLYFSQNSFRLKQAAFNLLKEDEAILVEVRLLEVPKAEDLFSEAEIGLEGSLRN